MGTRLNPWVMKQSVQLTPMKQVYVTNLHCIPELKIKVKKNSYQVNCF